MVVILIIDQTYINLNYTYSMNELLIPHYLNLILSLCLVFEIEPFPYSNKPWKTKGLKLYLSSISSK